MSTNEKFQVVRPASLVIRFTNSDRYKKAIELYSTLLNDEPAKSQSGVFASFQVGSAAKPCKRDIELRLELHPGDTTDLRGHTLIYWQIKPWNSKAAVDAVKAKLRKFGYGCENIEEQIVKGENRFLMTDGFDNFFGGHPTPPFPPGGGKRSDFRKHKRHSVENRWSPSVGSLLLGIAGGLAVASLLPNVLGLRHTSD